MRSEVVALPADWDGFTVVERFDFRTWVQQQGILPVGPYIRPRAQVNTLAQFLVGWISGLALVKGGVVTATNYQEQVLKNSPIGYWRLDQIVQNDPQLDISGEAGGPRNQFEISDPILNQAGLLFSDTPNLSCGFDGVDDRFFATQVSFWPNAEEPVTLECWFQAGAGANRVMAQIRQAGSSAASGESARLELQSTGRVTCQRNSTNLNTFPDVFDDSTPHHAVMTCPDSLGTFPTVHLYVDGVDYGTNTGAVFTGSAGTHQVNIGANRSSSASFFFDGLVDEVAVYDYELPFAQVVQHFNAGDAGIFT